jgi:hypothetical protein
MKSSFTSFLFTLPTSHFLISLFLFFSTLLSVYLILSLTKSGMILFQHHSYFSRHKNSRSLFYQICDLYCNIFCCQVIFRWPFWCPYIDTLFMCSYISSQCKFFPLSLVLLWRLCPPHDVFKLQLQRLSPLLLLSCRKWELHHIPSPKNYKILLWLFHRFLHLGRSLISMSNCNLILQIPSFTVQNLVNCLLYI